MGSNPSRKKSSTGAPPSLNNNNNPHHLTLNSLADDSCRNIFSFLTFNESEIIHLRNSCRLFRDSLPSPPCWTSFPHPKYNTLDKLFRALNILWNKVNDDNEEDDKEDDKDDKRSTFFPHLVLLGEGTYNLQHFFSARQATTMLTCPLTLIGVSREATVIQGGLEILGTRKCVLVSLFFFFFYRCFLLFFFFHLFFKHILNLKNSHRRVHMFDLFFFCVHTQNATGRSLKSFIWLFDEVLHMESFAKMEWIWC